MDLSKKEEKASLQTEYAFQLQLRLDGCPWYKVRSASTVEMSVCGVDGARVPIAAAWQRPVISRLFEEPKKDLVET